MRPEAPPERQRLRLQSGAGDPGALAVAEARDERLVLRALARIDSGLLPGTGQLLQAVYPVPDRYAPLAQRIETAVANYQQLEYLRDWLKLSMALILGLVLLLVLLAALLLALRASRRLVLPLVHLAAAAGEIGRGRYQPMPVLAAGDDELGDLVQAFNHMTRELRGAQASVRENQSMLEGQRAYLDAVLARISSAVIGFDRHGRVRLANPGSGTLLQVPAGELIGHDLDQLRSRQPELAPFLDRIQDHLRHAGPPWHEEVRLQQGDQLRMLLLRGSLLQEPEGGHGDERGRQGGQEQPARMHGFVLEIAPHDRHAGGVGGVGDDGQAATGDRARDHARDLLLKVVEPLGNGRIVEEPDLQKHMAELAAHEEALRDALSQKIAQGKVELKRGVSLMEAARWLQRVSVHLGRIDHNSRQLSYQSEAQKRPAHGFEDAAPAPPSAVVPHSQMGQIQALPMNR